MQLRYKTYSVTQLPVVFQWHWPSSSAEISIIRTVWIYISHAPHDQNDKYDRCNALYDFDDWYFNSWWSSMLLATVRLSKWVGSLGNWSLSARNPSTHHSEKLNDGLVLDSCSKMKSIHNPNITSKAPCWQGWYTHGVNPNKRLKSTSCIKALTLVTFSLTPLSKQVAIWTEIYYKFI